MLDSKMNSQTSILVVVVLLCAATAFMITAWFLHLKFESWAFWMAIPISWLIALPEYCCMIPASRIGFGTGLISVAGIMAVAEVLQIIGFIIFQTAILKQHLVVNHLVGFAILILGFLTVLIGPFNQVIVNGRNGPTSHSRVPGPLQSNI